MIDNTFVHHERAAALTAAAPKISLQPAVIKLGLDIHTKTYVVVAQHDHAALRPPQRFAPGEFVPWVEGLLAQGHTVHVVYEACSPILLPPLVPGAAASAVLASVCTVLCRRPGRTVW